MSIDQRRFPNRVALSAMAGINNSEFCSRFPVGLVVLGGFSVDSESIKASRKAVKRGRKEFLFENSLEGIEREIINLIGSGFKGVFAVNVRSATLDGYLDVAKIASRYGGIIEINAHCRQPEFTEIGCGQELLYRKEDLFSIVEEVSKHSITSVKIRGGLKNVKYVDVVKGLKDSGCDIVHLDAMIPGGKADYFLVEKISREIFTIGNNSVTDIHSALKMLKSGAKLVSAARAVLKDSEFFEKLLKEKKLAEEVVYRR
jgi:TIM-barrel protein